MCFVTVDSSMSLFYLFQVLSKTVWNFFVIVLVEPLYRKFSGCLVSKFYLKEVI